MLARAVFLALTLSTSTAATGQIKQPSAVTTAEWLAKCRSTAFTTTLRDLQTAECISFVSGLIKGVREAEAHARTRILCVWELPDPEVVIHDVTQYVGQRPHAKDDPFAFSLMIVLKVHYGCGSPHLRK